MPIEVETVDEEASFCTDDCQDEFESQNAVTMPTIANTTGHFTGNPTGNPTGNTPRHTMPIEVDEEALFCMDDWQDEIESRNAPTSPANSAVTMLTIADTTGDTTGNPTGNTPRHTMPIEVDEEALFCMDDWQDEIESRNAPTSPANSAVTMPTIANTTEDITGDTTGDTIANTTGNATHAQNTAVNPILSALGNHVTAIVVGLISVILFGILIFVIVGKINNNKRVTKILRVQFQETTGLNQYSGCFEINDHTRFSKRRTYNGLSDNDNTSFGYCIEERQWILFQDDGDVDPCDTTKNDEELARSSKTDSFDISTSFDELWVSSSNRPLDLFFFGDNEKDIKDHCGSTLGDGICDPIFNRRAYDFDDGDCCAATCTTSDCGRGGLTTSAFGDINSSGDGFPYCTDPEMVPITIHLNGISSSRDPEFAEYDPEWENPYFALDCDGKNVLTVYIEETMINNSETVMVEDGADCSLVVENTISSKTPNVVVDRPIWFISYTLFHGEKNVTGNEKIEILSQNSIENKRANFKRIPQCYFRKLENHTDIGSIYTAFNPSNKAIDWLVEDSTSISQCEDDEFIERYALVNMMFAMNGIPQYVSREEQCTWPTVTCSEMKVIKINLEDAGLIGDIPSEILLLPSLTELGLSGNGISLIPTEIGLMTSLQVIDLFSNQISLIPTEVGLMTSMVELRLYENQISMIPTEVGLMTSLVTLDLDQNQILLIPTEIGLMTSLKELRLFFNQISLIPTEVGLMTSLQELDLFMNQILLIPTEIGLMTSLVELNLYENQISFIPTEVGLMTSMQEFRLHYNQISMIPTDIGLMTSLVTLDLVQNQISLIPTEIGMMTSLQELDLYMNQISLIPTEIGLMISLVELLIYINQISLIPTEVGLMTGLVTLDLDINQISLIPTEIGMMISLESLLLSSNQISMIPTEIGLMTSLVTLHLYENQISMIPTEVGLMTSLVTLDLGSNQLTLIPTEIELMTSLESLYLDDNQISLIPTEIGLLTSLREIHFGKNGNRISFIPTEIGLLTSLESLYLYDNQISLIPTEIGLLTSLREIHFDGNQISFIPTEIGLLTSLESLYLGRNIMTQDDLPKEVVELCSATYCDFQDWSTLTNPLTILPTGTSFTMSPTLSTSTDILL